MAIFLDSNSRIIVQGMTGSEGMKHTTRMLAGGSNIVGGVNPRKAGETVEIDGKSLPVFGTVAEAMAATGANVSVIFVPPAFAKAAVVEAIDAGLYSAANRKEHRIPYDGIIEPQTLVHEGRGLMMPRIWPELDSV